LNKPLFFSKNIEVPLSKAIRNPHSR